MERNKKYYELFLRQKETDLLDSVGDILQIELILYDLRKLYLRSLDLGEEGNEVSEQLRNQERHLRRLIVAEQARIADLELDIAHAKFMLTLLDRK